MNIIRRLIQHLNPIRDRGYVLPDYSESLRQRAEKKKKEMGTAWRGHRDFSGTWKH